MNTFTFPSWLGSLAISSVKSNMCVRESAEGENVIKLFGGIRSPLSLPHPDVWQWMEGKGGQGG